MDQPARDFCGVIGVLSRRIHDLIHAGLCSGPDAGHGGSGSGVIRDYEDQPSIAAGKTGAFAVISGRRD